MATRRQPTQPEGLESALSALQTPQRVQPGNLWQLGSHRLLCGDANNEGDVARLMSGAKVDSCITDPPYGISHDLDYRRFTNGKRPQRKWGGILHGDAAPFDPQSLLSFRHIVLWGANSFSERLPQGSFLVWDKRHANGTAYVSEAEVAWMKGGHAVHLHSLTWQGFIRGTREPHVHPTQKPVALMEWCLDKAKAGAAVYDPYCGSGPVLLACERTGRACYALEIEPRYCDVILARWEVMTGQRAILLDTTSPANAQRSNIVTLLAPPASTRSRKPVKTLAAIHAVSLWSEVSA